MPLLSTLNLLKLAPSLKVNGLPCKAATLGGSRIVVLIATANPHLRRYVDTLSQPWSLFDHGRFSVRDLDDNLLVCQVERKPSQPPRRKADRLARTVLALGSRKLALRSEGIRLP